MSDILESIEDASDKLKAAAKAAVSKVKDPERDIQTEYQKEKMKEETLEKLELAETTTTTTITPVTSTTPVAATSTKLSKLTLASIPQYKRILVPHDESGMSDKALSHAIYLSNTTGAEIVILNVIENIDQIPHTSISATTKEEEEKEEVPQNKSYDTNLVISLEGEVKQRMEEKLRLCKEAGSTSQLSYRVQTGKAVDEILRVSEEMNIDLIVMASTKITSTIMGIIQQSTAKKVIDSVNRPVLVIYEQQQRRDKGT